MFPQFNPVRAFFQPLTKEKKMTVSESIDYKKELIKNSLNFSIKATENFDENYDGHVSYAKLNLWTGIDLILKARLAMEHWTLIVKTSESFPDFKAFEKGDFESIDFKTCTKKLKKILGIEIEQEKFLKDLQKQRNKIVHFYLLDEGSESGLKDMMIRGLGFFSGFLKEHFENQVDIRQIKQIDEWCEEKRSSSGLTP